MTFKLNTISPKMAAMLIEHLDGQQIAAVGRRRTWAALMGRGWLTTYTRIGHVHYTHLTKEGSKVATTLAAMEIEKRMQGDVAWLTHTNPKTMGSIVSRRLWADQYGAEEPRS